MLVLARKSREWVEIVGVGRVYVRGIDGNCVRLAFDIPNNFRIIRGELDLFPAAPATSANRSTVNPLRQRLALRRAG